MECPVCKEVIKKGALMCRFCGSDLRRFYEMNEMNYDEENLKEQERHQEEIKVENFSESTLSDSIPTVEENIYRRKVDFVDREGGER
jgi:uncharacterized Zn finger protein (UPF0148 family)